MLHIKIVKEETQEVLVDDTTNCLIGVYGKGEKGEHGMAFVNGCTGKELMAVLLSVKDTIKDVLKAHPEIALLLNAYEKGKTNNE